MIKLMITQKSVRSNTMVRSSESREHEIQNEITIEDQVISNRLQKPANMLMEFADVISLYFVAHNTMHI